jgi:hypothetical protein
MEGPAPGRVGSEILYGFGVEELAEQLLVALPTSVIGRATQVRFMQCVSGANFLVALPSRAPVDERTLDGTLEK